MNVEVPGSRFGGQHRYKMGSDCSSTARWLLQAIGIALGALSMALGAVLERLRSLPGGPREIDGRSGGGGKWEVKGRLGDHLSLTMAPGEPHYQRLPGKNNNQRRRSEHALGQRPGELQAIWVLIYYHSHDHYHQSLD